jgi:hypothetical protein
MAATTAAGRSHALRVGMQKDAGEYAEGPALRVSMQKDAGGGRSHALRVGMQKDAGENEVERQMALKEGG